MERMSSIELAIKNESSEMEYYLNESKRSTNPVAKALFATLAEDEKEHMTRLRGLHAKLVGSGSWPENVAIEVAGTNIKKVLEAVPRQYGSEEDHDDDDLKALRKGIDFETSGAQFYADLSAKCKNPQEAKFFKFLAGIEREHMLSIQDSLLFLEDPAGWHESHEHIHLDGV
ncbi:MAG: ferritin family protein [Myxococcota bacterium]|jgi:rubrerythrin|nr:ferritin family protein [Myxococcota bacterium]